MNGSASRRLGVLLASLGLLATLLSLPAGAADRAEADRSVGFISCSNGLRAVEQYNVVLGGSTLWQGREAGVRWHAYGGESLAEWGNPNRTEGWDQFRAYVAEHGVPEKVWFQLCIKHGNAGPDFTATELAQAEYAIGRIQAEAPGATIYVSGLVDEFVGFDCRKVGPYGPEASNRLAAHLAATYGEVEAGPVLTALDSGTIDRDNCHPGWDTGAVVHAQDLEDFFG